MAEINQKDFMQTVHQIGLFSRLSEEECGALSTLAERREVAAGQVIFDEGARTPGLYLVHSGTVEIRKKRDNGEYRKLAQLEAPSCLGEMSFVADQQTSAQAFASTDCVFFCIGKDEFRNLLKAGSVGAYKLIAAIASILSRRLKAMDEEVVKILADQPKPKQEQFAAFKKRFFTEFNY